MIFLLLLFILVPVVLAIMAFWVWMLVSALTNPGLGDGEKVGWVLAVIFLHFLGAILYFFIGRPKRKMLAA